MCEKAGFVRKQARVCVGVAMWGTLAKKHRKCKSIVSGVVECAPKTTTRSRPAS